MGDEDETKKLLQDIGNCDRNPAALISCTRAVGCPLLLSLANDGDLVAECVALHQDDHLNQLRLEDGQN